MEKTYQLQKFDSGMHYISLDQATVAPFLQQANKRVLCTINGRMKFHGAILQNKEAGYFIYIGSGICKQLNIKTGSSIQVAFEPDNSPYQFDMPEELAAVLQSDEAADTAFHALTSGNQRSLIYLVLQVKSSEKRIERALKIAEKIKHGIVSARVILK